MLLRPIWESATPLFMDYDLIMYSHNTHVVFLHLLVIIDKSIVIIDISNKNERIDDISNIMLKSHVIFADIFTLCFSNAGKTVNVPEFEDKRF